MTVTRHQAPEVFDGQYTSLSEVYAYGIVGSEVLTGRLPWEGPRFTESVVMKWAAAGPKPLHPLHPLRPLHPRDESVVMKWAAAGPDFRRW